jgi:MFS family permease
VSDADAPRGASGDRPRERFVPAPYQPWWLRGLPFLGRVPLGVERREVGLVGIMALALLFEHYDAATLTNAAKFIRESFGISQAELGSLLGWIRLGALPAVFLVLLTDRIGRRRLFLLSLTATSLGTALTVFTQSPWQFIAAQMLVRTGLIAGSAVAFVIVAEEVPAQHRGWAIGILGALALLGTGLATLAFSAIESLPYGWRALYVPGVIPLLMLPFFRRRVPETARFRESLRARAGRGGALAMLEPVLALIRRYPARALALAAIGSFAAIGHAVAHQLMGDYVQTDRGWSPGQFTLLVVVGGGIGIVGNTVMGRWADRFGRRAMTCVALAGFPFAAVAAYSTESWLLAASWIVLVFVTTGGNTLIRALAAELFPTSARGTATGSLTLFETLGATTGLFLVTLLTPEGESIAGAVRVIVFFALLGGILAFTLPETARRELEEISPG